MALCCSHTACYYFGLCKKSVAQKLSDELHFLEISCM